MRQSQKKKLKVESNCQWNVWTPKRSWPLRAYLGGLACLCAFGSSRSLAQESGGTATDSTSAQDDVTVEEPVDDEASEDTGPGSEISGIDVEGNRAVQPEAITELMDLKVGSRFRPGLLSHDIRQIFESGFFDDVQIQKIQDGSSKIRLKVIVNEKPSVREIRFAGFEEVSEDSVREKLQTKIYTIISDSKLNADLRTIEQLYVEKGYYLAKASYRLEKTESGEIDVVFQVTENSRITVKRVNLLGNLFFSDGELKDGMFTRSERWGSFLTSAGTFKDEFVNRDKEFLGYYYKDNGFAEAAVSAPLSEMSVGREAVEVTYSIEEGQQYNIGKISFKGDLLYSDQELREKLALKEGELFRISRFMKDTETLQDAYGDLGYAFADIVPKTAIRRADRLMDIEYEITKGDKVYFRRIEIIGNSKTRDNVIRRNIKVAEGELFHATRLRDSKSNIERLGFFEEVQIQRLPDAKNKAMDIQVKVKEKSTGSLSASIGAQPTRDGDVTFFAQGKYAEANLLGYGWSADLSFDLTPPPESDASFGYGISSSFREPSINDGPWSLGVSGRWNFSEERPFDQEPLATSQEYYAGVFVGREIIEDLRLSVGYRFRLRDRGDVSPFIERFEEKGITEVVVTSLTYDRTNNFLFPTAGFYLGIENNYATPIFAGDHSFGRAEFTAEYYIPLTIGDDFLTNFRFLVSPGYMYPVGGQPIPPWERFRLGSPLQMKAYRDRDRVISPRTTLIDSPYGNQVQSWPSGGNRRLFGSAEYFVPLIPQANLRLVGFGEVGDVVAEGEEFSVDRLKYDVGFGFRWQTPIAPFRFEFAFPVEEGRLGTGQFVLFIGADTASRF